jgi:hypothetical protein
MHFQAPGFLDKSRILHVSHPADSPAIDEPAINMPKNTTNSWTNETTSTHGKSHIIKELSCKSFHFTIFVF